MITQEPLPIFTDDRGVRGSIVNTASVSGTSALLDLSACNSSKHAVVIMTRVDARQFAPDRIRVNSVCPGYVPTTMMTSAGFSEERFNLIKTLSPMKRITYPEEVAETVVFLSSSRASAITGVDLAVDAGATLYHIVFVSYSIRVKVL
jgi:NAD(P)-dependent dehydrogenase (short-subunit alcohol dehydrogenase family)